MTIEQLLLLLILVAVPLLERLLRVVRERTSDSAREAAAAAAVPAVSPPPVPPPAPGVLRTAQRPLLAALPVLPPRPPDGAPGARLQPALTGRRTPLARRRAAARDVTRGGDLRRAMTLMVILGPCRAIEPTDPSRIW